MKKEAIVLSVLILAAAIFSGVDAHAQAVLQGHPSLNNFIGSPGMWVIAIGIVLMIILVTYRKRKAKITQDTPVPKKPAV